MLAPAKLLRTGSIGDLRLDELQLLLCLPLLESRERGFSIVLGHLPFETCVRRYEPFSGGLEADVDRVDKFDRFVDRPECPSDDNAGWDVKECEQGRFV